MFTFKKTYQATICVVFVSLLSAGAGAGAIGSSILTGGSTAGTLGGAAVGSLLGHELKK